ncbi:MAG: deoxyhypusine synthase [Planctomycetaceae bacterium]|nr:deoxyhypusine synthase [Planctomycetaceae bacterium]
MQHEKENTPVWLQDKACPRRKAYLAGRRIAPPSLTGSESLCDVIERTMLAYNSARLREGCELVVKKMLEPDVTVGLTLAGALTPAGLGPSCVVPLIKAGFVDWIVATGANLYHDLHFAFDCALHTGTPHVNDADLRENGVVRIYDVLLDLQDCLIHTDTILEQILRNPEFQEEMGMAELHYRLGRHAAEQEEAHGLQDVSVLAAAYRADVPVYTSSPGDSSIGMVIAKLMALGHTFRIDPFHDVNETASFVLAAKRSGGKSGVMLMGGGSPKNFMLQTEPQLQDSFRVLEAGHDYFLQVTDARPDTGGLSGATPHEAVSWGKVDPDALPDAVVCYADTTIVLPLLTHYALSRHQPRQLRRLYQQRAETMQLLHEEARRNLAVKS